MLKAALEQCDHLVIALNSDESVRRLKGSSRPLWNFETRFNAIYDYCLGLRAKGCKATCAIIPFEGKKDPLLMNLRPDTFFVGYDHSAAPVFYAASAGKTCRTAKKHGKARKSSSCRTCTASAPRKLIEAQNEPKTDA
jgi:bifunctional ADP-heptose synthase (sugar kinase/adenylyltransferase)